MTDEKNLLRRFLKDDNQTDELECFLSTLGGASQEEKGVINFSWLQVEYEENGRDIKAIRSIEPHDQNLLSGLERKTHEALRTDHETDVGEAYFFTYPPVVGAFRLGDILQIIPIPADAPKIEPSTLLEKHPAILQFTHVKSTHEHVNQHRRGKRKRELLLVLNTLLGNRISWIDNTGRNEWVWDIPDGDMTKYSFQNCQVGYSPRQSWSERDDLGFFVNPEWQEIPCEKHADYYKAQGVLFGDPFRLPDSLETSIVRYEQLSDDESALFLRSAHWLATSSSVFWRSHSLAYVSLVYALEGLMQNATKIGQCESCGRDQFDKSVSKRFREFLEEYRAGLPKEYVDEIYGLRSAIAHGGGLMPRDREITGFRFTAEQNKKNDLFRLLQMVCQVVLLNWLHSDKRTIIE